MEKGQLVQYLNAIADASAQLSKATGALASYIASSKEDGKCLGILAPAKDAPSDVQESDSLCTFTIAGDNPDYISPWVTVKINGTAYSPIDCKNIPCNPGDKITFVHDTLISLKGYLDMNPELRKQEIMALLDGSKEDYDIDAMLSEYDKTGNANKFASCIETTFLEDLFVNWDVLGVTFMTKKSMSIDMQNHCHIVVPESARGEGRVTLTETGGLEGEYDVVKADENNDCGWIKDCEIIGLGE